MVIQGVKPFIERLLALRAEIALAAIRSFTMFMGAGITTEPTFHSSGLRVDALLLYLTHHDLMHYPIDEHGKMLNFCLQTVS